MPLAPVMGRGLKIAYPVFLEVAYQKRLLRFVRDLKRLSTEYILNNFKFQSSLNEAIRNDDIVDDLEYYLRILNAAISVEAAKIIQTLSQRFTAVRKFTYRSFNKSFAHLVTQPATADFSLLSTSVPTTNTYLLKKMWIDKNTQLIRNIPAESLVKIRDAVYEAIRSGQSMQSLSVRLNDIFELTEKRAKIIARDQISKLKSDLSRHNDLSHGITMYEWSTCKDGAVRASHEVMQGKICSWLDATIYKNKITNKWKKRSSIGGIEKHVGADIMCRCTNIILHEGSRYAG